VLNTVLNMDKNRIIKSFSIKGLFGTTDIIIPFEDKVKILIGENGLGKTQVLNMFYYTLTKKFDRLAEYIFDSIIIEFADNEKIHIHKSDVDKLLFEHPIVKEVVKRIGAKQFLELRNYFGHAKDLSFELRRNSTFRRRLDGLPVSMGMLTEALEVFAHNKQDDLFSFIPKEKQKAIDKHISDYQILYFPTYRRVEEDLRNLGYDEENFSINREDTRLINFGMDDVDRRFYDLTKSIERLSTEGLSNISGEILSQLVEDGMPEMEEGFLTKIEKKDIEIIFARAGNKIKSDQKDRIKSIVETGKIQEKDKFLLYFLQKLINIYDQQRELDSSIKIFRDICNKYLVNKEVVYDESSIEIYIRLNDSTDKLQLNKLSSGEKQIISIFSKIYLAPSECNFIVLFDEPELSLSIFWQRELLPDIYNSGKCQFLLAVTHSPFIFENSLDKYAIELSQYIKPNLQPIKETVFL
jgi:predicted ATP-dependent endonuclease of OLD family